MTEKLAYTLKEAAAAIQVSYPTIRKMLRENDDFPHFHNGREYRIPCDAFKEWVNERA